MWAQPTPKPPAAKVTELERAIAIFKAESENLGLRGNGSAVVRTSSGKKQKFK